MTDKLSFSVEKNFCEECSLRKPGTGIIRRRCMPDEM